MQVKASKGCQQLIMGVCEAALVLSALGKSFKHVEAAQSVDVSMRVRTHDSSGKGGSCRAGTRNWTHALMWM
eukprot:2976795-Pleurochrysis_carterae.AAC.2